MGEERDGTGNDGDVGGNPTAWSQTTIRTAAPPSPISLKAALHAELSLL